MMRGPLTREPKKKPTNALLPTLPPAAHLWSRAWLVPPTRAPDNQCRQMLYYLDYVRNTNVLNAWGWGQGFLFPSATSLVPGMALAPRGCGPSPADPAGGGKGGAPRPPLRCGGGVKC